MENIKFIIIGFIIGSLISIAITCGYFYIKNIKIIAENNAYKSVCRAGVYNMNEGQNAEAQ